MSTLDIFMLALGGLQSFVFEYLPGVSEWFEALKPIHKMDVVLFFAALTAAGLMFSSCTGLYDVGLSCDKAGVMELVRLFVFVVAGGGLAHAKFKKPNVLTISEGEVE